MELRQIQYFIEVAKREHVTEAAEALLVAQSAVSRQIANLETELGVQLFIRQGRRVKLTSIGRGFLEHMEQAMKVIDNAKREIEEHLDPERGTIRIGYPSSLITYTLPNVISAFLKRYPYAKFQLFENSYRRLIDSVESGEINIALIGPLPPLKHNLIGDILFVENIVALLPANHPLANRHQLKLSELRHDAFIMFPNGFILQEIVFKACQEDGFQPKIAFEGENMDTIKGLVSAGLGVTLMPEVALVDNLPPSTVKIPLANPQVTRTVGVIIPKERKLLPTEKLFYEFLKEFDFDIRCN